MDGGDHRFAESLDPVHQRLALAHEVVGLLARLQRNEFVDVGAGNERVGFTGDQHHGADRAVRGELPQDLF